MVASSVAGISPCYSGRNGSLLSIGQKGRFPRVEMQKRKQNRKKSKEQKEMVVSPSAIKVKASL